MYLCEVHTAAIIICYIIKKQEDKTMRSGKRILSCLLSFAIAVTMMCGLFVVDAGAYTNTGDQREDIISIAEGEIDNKGQINHRNKYTLGIGSVPNFPDGGYGYDWCCAFVSWCGKTAGISSSIINRGTGTATQKNFYNNQGVWFASKNHGGTYTPRRGDLIYFQWNGYASGTPSHVGIVRNVEGSTVYTVEGNTNNDGTYTYVAPKSYDINSNKIMGYAVPNYTDTSVKTFSDIYASSTYYETDSRVYFSTKFSSYASKVGVLLCRTGQDFYDSGYSMNNSNGSWSTTISGFDHDTDYYYQFYGVVNGTTIYSDINVIHTNPNPIGDFGNEFYSVIKNVHTGKVLANDRMNVALRTWDTNSMQKWKFERQSDGSYKIINCYDGYVLENENGGTENGTNIIVAPDNGSDWQRWYLKGAWDNCSIISKYNEKAVDVNGASDVEGNNIHAWYNSGHLAQRYILSPIETSVNNAAAGYLDIVEEQNGMIRIAGWAYDPDTPDSELTISYTVLDSNVENPNSLALENMGVAVTNVYRSDVNSLYNLSGNHGFDVLHEISTPGTYNVEVSARDLQVGYYTVLGSGKVTVDSPKHDIGRANVYIYPPAYLYTGSQIKPEVTVYYNDNTLINGKDYTVAYSKNIKPGTGIITVTGKGDYTGTATQTFMIIDLNPTVKATPGDKQVTLKWDAVEDATKYAVSRYVEGKYIEENYNVTGTSYTVKNLKNGTKYQFLVQAYIGGKWTAVNTANLVSATPLNINPTVTATAGDKQVTLKWNAVSGATKYGVSRYDGSKYIEVNYNVTGTSYTVKNLTNGKTYKFLVQAYVNGKWSSISTALLVSATPKASSSINPVVTATAGDKQVTLKWKAISGATKYAVSLYDNGKYIEENYNVTSTSYTVKRLTNGKTYKFLVQAYVGGKWSSISTTLLVSATPKASSSINPVVTATAGDKQVTLKWKAISGATKYAVSLYDNGKYIEENYNVTSTSYTVKRLTNGKTYKFLVQAYVGGKWSSISTTLLVSVKPSATPSNVPVVTATSGNGSVTLKWNTVSGATKYAISIYDNGKYVEENYNVTSTSHTVKRLTNGKTYKFLVQAYVNGKWSPIDTKYLVSATPKA